MYPKAKAKGILVQRMEVRTIPNNEMSRVRVRVRVRVETTSSASGERNCMCMRRIMLIQEDSTIRLSNSTIRLSMPLGMYAL